jgi:hypothetical protein
MMRDQRELTVAPGRVVRRLTAEQVVELCAQWLVAFPADRSGIHIEEFMWHVFSFDRYPSVARAAAVAQYEQHEAPQYAVLSNDKNEGLVTDLRPTSASVADYLVCPLNLAWTMFFTHEDDCLGPYFARHREYDQLQAANRKGLRKRDEAAAAKQKGWSR